MKKLSSVLLLATLMSTNAQAHGIGPINCGDWYKNPLVAVICGVGAVIEAPFALMDYLDEKGLAKTGIIRKEGQEFNEYTFKKNNSKLVIFNMRSSSLADAKDKCASVNGRLATKEEADLLEKGSSHDADILYSRLFLNYGPDNKVVDVATTGFIDGVEGKDVFLHYKTDNRKVVMSSEEVRAILDASSGNDRRANFDENGILQPICFIK